MTVSEVVKALGGNQAVAEHFGVGVTAVSNWRTWDKFPLKLHLQIVRLCATQGINYDPDPRSARRKRAA